MKYLRYRYWIFLLLFSGVIGMVIGHLVDTSLSMSVEIGLCAAVVAVSAFILLVCRDNHDAEDKFTSSAALADLVNNPAACAKLHEALAAEHSAKAKAPNVDPIALAAHLDMARRHAETAAFYKKYSK